MEDTLTKELAKAAFRPRARLLSLLGEQLIDNARLAVFEMVKNAYDADANHVTVAFEHPDETSGSIIVEDDGSGMTLQILRDVWLEPGADLREIQRRDGVRSPKYHRLPLGEKGVGRFAAHKLGNEIKLWTRAEDGPELHVAVNWNEQIDRRYMDETEVEILQTESEHFADGQTGTRIQIDSLREEWTRGDVRRLWRNVTSISGPFSTKDDFDVTLKIVGPQNWVKGLKEVGDILDSALWKYDFRFDSDGYDWSYEFRPPRAMPIKGDKSDKEKSSLPFPKRLAKLFVASDEKIPPIVPTSFADGIGPIEGSFFVFDQDREVVVYIHQPSQITTFLEENGGVRVYRDDIRVYSYGEPGDDWLGLDLRRVNQPTKAISNNNIVGLISVEMEKSTGLKEKTSRDGFDDNKTYQRFRAIVISALSHLEALRGVDKARMRRVLTKKSVESHISPNAALAELKAEVEKKSLGDQIGKLVAKVEDRVKNMQDTLLRPGATQMHIATLFHEVEHGVRALNAAIRREEPFELIQQKSAALIELLDSFANFFRKTPAEKIAISRLVNTVLKLNADRIERHNIILSSPLNSGEATDFVIEVPRNIVMGAISNVIDNSIYWLDQKWPDDTTRKKRAIRIETSDYFAEGPALILADNGPGYRLPPEDILQPFISMKPDGMGIGMYYARLVLEACGGFVAFPEPEDVGLPKSYSGAVTAFVFPNAESVK